MLQAAELPEAGWCHRNEHKQREDMIYMSFFSSFEHDYAWTTETLHHCFVFTFMTPENFEKEERKTRHQMERKKKKTSETMIKKRSDERAFQMGCTPPWNPLICVLRSARTASLA